MNLFFYGVKGIPMSSLLPLYNVCPESSLLLFEKNCFLLNEIRSILLFQVFFNFHSFTKMACRPRSFGSLGLPNNSLALYEVDPSTLAV